MFSFLDYGEWLDLALCRGGEIADTYKPFLLPEMKVAQARLLIKNICLKICLLID